MSDVLSSTGILLVNLGSPEAPSVRAVRHYLGEFLSDPHVVPIPRFIWQLILHGWILRVRPAQSAAKYQSIWTRDGSPLMIHSQRQVSLLKGFMGESGKQAHIALAMRYGKPSLPEKLSYLQKQGCTRLLILPLYPQYTSSTTASVIDVVQQWAQKNNDIHHLHVLNDFHDFMPYITALAQNIQDAWQKHGKLDGNAQLLMSFHGVPQKNINQGDPYHAQCLKTASLLAKALNLADNRWSIAFQSQFGRGQWLQPDTVSVLKSLGAQGIQRVDVVCPGFIADCLETLEEIDIKGQKAFLAAGGQKFNRIDSLNERDDWIHALVALVHRELEKYC